MYTKTLTNINTIINIRQYNKSSFVYIKNAIIISMYE